MRMETETKKRQAKETREKIETSHEREMADAPVREMTECQSSSCRVEPRRDPK